MGVPTTLWRAFDKTVRRKPLAFAADAVYGNSIDLGLEVVAKKGVARKVLLLMFVDILLLGFTPVMVLPSSSSFKQRYRCTYIRGSVRRVSGFVLTSKPEVNFRIANNPLRTHLSAVTLGAPPGSFGSRQEASGRFDARIRSFGERDKPMRARHSAP